MKKIILSFVIIVSINYNVKAQISLTGNITTAGVAVYPTHIDSLGKGGLMTLPDLTTRNAIPVKRRKQGMLVYIQANDSLYKLTTADVSLNTGWVAMGLLTQQKLSDSLNARLKATDTLSLSARIDLKANAGTISDVTTLLADKLKITDTSFLLQKADTASLSNRINLKTNTVDFNTLSTTVATKFKTTDTSYLLQKADTISLSNRINLKLDANKTGVANGVASLNALGKIPSDQIPAISFSSVRIISSEAEMLGLTSAVVGSVAVRTDVNKSFILSAGDPTVLANWVMLLTPAPPVQSVNTYSGNVNLTKTDIGLGNVDDYSAENLPLSLASRNALALKLKITDTSYLLQKADTISLSNRIISSVASITAETTRATAAETSLTNKITSNTSSITTNLNSITTLNTNVSANTSSISSLTTKINSNTASITANTSDILLRATILSPSFTGTPTATTAPALTNTTQLATTAFVRTAVTNLTGLTNSNLSGSAGITDANLANITTAGKVSNSATSATASNTSYTIVARDAVGDFSANNITASLNGTALIATNIEGGAAGSIPYQSANNTTALLAKGTNGQFLQLTSGIPSWQTISTSVSASNITGTVALSNGGTGQTDVAGIKSILGLTGNKVAIGTAAGIFTQSANSVAVGGSAGRTSQGDYAVAVGSIAGYSNQAINTVAIGAAAGQTSQASNAVALGYIAGNSNQGTYAVAIGSSAGQNSQAANSVAIGAASAAAYTNSIAIGYGAITTAANTIQLGSDGTNSILGTTTAITNVKTSGTLTAGTVTYPNAHGTNGQLLTTTGTGTLTWTAAYAPTDASNTAKGIIQLAGDFRGTATSPTVNTVGGVNSSTIATFDTRITSATNSITSTTASINTLNTNVASNTASITSLNTSILASTITGTVAVLNGGTGQTSIPGLKNILGLTTANVAIGNGAGQTSQGYQGIAIGSSAGTYTQSAGAIALGNGAGQTSQGNVSVAIGYVAGSSNQGAYSVAIGSNAAQSGQGTQSVAIGIAANSGGNNATGLGAYSNAGGNNSTALGYYASSGIYSSTAIGGYASAGYANSTAIGYQAKTTAANTIQLGADGVTIAGSTAITNVKTSGTLTAGAVTYPNTQGTSGQILSTIGTGTLTWTNANTAAGLTGNQVTIGANAGNISQSEYAVAIGNQAGQTSQGSHAVAIGYLAGNANQGDNSVAIGTNAAQNGQGQNAVALGISSSSAANLSTAIGGFSVAGYNNSTAIGYQATTTADNSIQLGNSNLTSVNTSGTINTIGAVNAKSFNLNSSTAITAATTTTIDLSTSNIFKVSLGADISVLTLNNAKPGTYIIEFIQGASTLYNVTFPSGWKWAAGLVPIVTQTINKIDIVTLVYDGSTYFASAVQNF